MIFLYSCTVKPGVYSVEVNGMIYELDTEKRTINDGLYTYQYEFTGNTRSYNITITFPDGVKYGCKKNGGPLVFWSSDYVDSKYSSTDTLCDVILSKAPKGVNIKKIMAGILIMSIGIFNFAFPKAACYLECGWKFKNSEPTDFYLAMTKIVGIIIFIVGLLLAIF